MGVEELKIDPKRYYEVKIPREVFVVLPTKEIVTRKVEGCNIRDDGVCPVCGGAGKVIDPGLDELWPGMIKKVRPAQSVSCPLCGGSGSFDYSTASEITQIEVEDEN
ncbi:hypothetical protein CEE36_11080 [candidate division TA06 bacterium B3_TA06]|uniref:Uncharacterized protein n=1 Tax=candidate division TA06 bacterium B3_TA06 TaxID=2012487 RepID=A0A532URS0_UNCT6|nr:MAG: hypothetical protein CEE36_11080 [candidate division TA06 bacterium B3_TA06]